MGDKNCFAWGETRSKRTINHFGLASLRRLLRGLQIPYYDNFAATDYSQRASSKTTQFPANGVSVQLLGKPTPQASSSQAFQSPAQINLTQVYLEVCILRHPSLNGHPYLPELLAETLLCQQEDSVSYRLGRR